MENHQESKEILTAVKEENGISPSGSGIKLTIQERGLFGEDDFFESARHQFYKKDRRTLSEYPDDDCDVRRGYPVNNDQKEIEKENIYENENEYMVSLWKDILVSEQ